MDENLETINGCLWDGATDQDRKLTGEMIDYLPTLEEQDQIIFEYDQSWTPDCTIYSALGALSDLFNRELTPAHFEEANEESFKRWRVPGKWRYTKEAVDCSCDLWMKRFPEDKVAYYRISNYDDETIKKVIEKNYSLCTSFNGSNEYQKDRKDNGQIDNAKQWKTTYGHAVCLIEREGKRFVKDNYKGRKENGRYTNIYWIIPEISELKRNGVRQNYSYLIVKVKSDKEKDIERLNKMKNQIDSLIENTENVIKQNSEMRELTNDRAYKERLHATNDQLRLILISHKQKKEDIEKELSKYFIS